MPIDKNSFKVQGDYLWYKFEKKKEGDEKVGDKKEVDEQDGWQCWNVKKPHSTKSVPEHQGSWVTSTGDDYRYQSWHIDKLRKERKLYHAVTSLNTYLKKNYDRLKHNEHRRMNRAEKAKKTTVDAPVAPAVAPPVGAPVTPTNVRAHTRVVDTPDQTMRDQFLLKCERDKEFHAGLMGNLATVNTKAELANTKAELANTKANKNAADIKVVSNKVNTVESEANRSAVKSKKTTKNVRRLGFLVRKMAVKTGDAEIAEAMSWSGSSATSSFKSPINALFGRSPGSKKEGNKDDGDKKLPAVAEDATAAGKKPTTDLVIAIPSSAGGNGGGGGTDGVSPSSETSAITGNSSPNSTPTNDENLRPQSDNDNNKKAPSPTKKSGSWWFWKK